jgi:hypothetical protein
VAVATPLQPVSVAGTVDQDAARGLGGGEEVTPAVPILRLCAPTRGRYASWARAVGWSV